MGLMDWLARWFGKRPPDEIPEVLGSTTDSDGRQVELRRGPRQHEGLSNEQIQRVARLQTVLSDAYPMTLDGWIDGFLRDSNPESEIQILEAVAAVYQRHEPGLASGDKKRVYAVLCMLSAGASPADLQGELPAGAPTAESLRSEYRSARDSGSRPETPPSN